MFKQGQQACLIMVFTGFAFGIKALVTVGLVVPLEFFPLETGSHALGCGDNPLQKGVGLVVHGRGIEQRIGFVFARLTAGKRIHIAAHQIRRMPL